MKAHGINTVSLGTCEKVEDVGSKSYKDATAACTAETTTGKFEKRKTAEKGKESTKKKVTLESASPLTSSVDESTSRGPSVKNTLGKCLLLGVLHK